MPAPHIVSGSSDSTVKVWCVEHTTDCAKVMRTHNGEVMCVEAEENKVASGGVDGKVCLW
jgi:WD40 repeat protein